MSTRLHIVKRYKRTKKIPPQNFCHTIGIGLAALPFMAFLGLCSNMQVRYTIIIIDTINVLDFTLRPLACVQSPDDAV